VATDLTPAMLVKARPRLRTGMHLAIMDGHHLAVRAASFDAVVLHLIVAVIPDPVRCVQEVARVLRPGGRAVIFDKFAGSARPRLLLRLVNVLTGALFTEVTRNLETILDQSGRALLVERDEPALFGSTFRRVLLRKPA
jgi:phosphatidylethanolamine/phosphatidyl-N-methylethanolamine N-methyltransferase